jgi:hypothetical protein
MDISNAARSRQLLFQCRTLASLSFKKSMDISKAARSRQLLFKCHSLSSLSLKMFALYVTWQLLTKPENTPITMYVLHEFTTYFDLCQSFFSIYRINLSLL